MQYLDIILNLPLNQTFTYSWTPKEDEKPELRPEAGKRAEVRFGNRRMTGFVAGVHDEIPALCPVPPEKIRPVTKILDSEPLVSEELFDLARWISRYYLCAIGEAVSAVVPAGRRETEPDFPPDEDISGDAPKTLSGEQRDAVEGILAAAESGKSEYHYLYGPTGTGKTEVFFQAAERLLERGRGVIYLVPEIGLTHQVAEAASRRFGNTAAVLHSGLSQGRRLSEWKRILHGKARIVIGARSAVFAPVPDLGMIIIDEEHDGSYKSGTTPRYHARQAAMYRCARLGIPLVMGSATPSAEAWNLMRTGRLVRHSLTGRLSGGAAPQIKCIDLSMTKNTGCISEELADEVRRTLAAGRQSILFLNRRGFTHFFRCNGCGFELTCKNCSVPLTYHRNENRLRCHYCGWSAEPPDSCPKCGSLDIGYSGFGTEYIEAETAAKFPGARIVRVDTDSMTRRGELAEKLSAFRRGDYDIMLGTQMVAKGLNFPKLRLVGVVLADTGLHLPDFRASERTFALITQVAGRAGRFFPDGKVLVQTYNPSREPVAFACAGDTEGFYEYELRQRRLLGFPPFSRLVRLVFRSPSQRAAAETAGEAAAILRGLCAADGAAAQGGRADGRPGTADGADGIAEAGRAEVIGPAECPVLKISRNFRYQVLLRGGDIRTLRAAAGNLLYGYTHPQNVYIECDVDPVRML